MKRLWTGVPGASGRWTRALACGVGAVLLAAPSLPLREDGAVISLSIVPTSGQAQVVIGVNGAVTVRDFVLHGPERIVVDIAGATLGMRKGGYDRVARGGVLDVRYAQNQPNVVRVVLTLAGPKSYKIVRNPGEIRVSVEGGGDFTAWRAGARTYAAAAPAMATPPMTPPVTPPVTPPSTPPAPMPKVRAPVDTPPPLAPVPATVTMVSSEPPASALPQQQPQQPRITIAWEKADIRDVLAAFAAFSGRTIIPSKGVEATVTAEIIDKPWDVAMKAILNAYGYDAREDANGIIVVNSLEALAAQPHFEQLSTRTIRFNYTNPAAVAAALQSRLSKDCGTLQSATTGAPANVPAAASSGPMNCPVRGAITFDTLTNTVSITDVSSAIDNLIAYAQTLDVRQPQVNIKAKIILVDRTQLEGLGLKYDIGTRNQHFNELVSHNDSLGAPEQGNTIFLGGNTVSAIANAAAAVPNAALRVIYSASIGGFDFTTFLEALQEVSLLDIQAEPSVTTLNYRLATLKAGTEVPIRTIEQGTGSAAGALPRVTVSTRQTGVVLSVTPAITNNRQIMMRVHAENSDVQFVAGDVGAVFPTQSIDNELLVADGETAVMGGLTQTSVRITKTGIPILIDLPLIGRLFGVTNRSETKRDLLILITPHIVDEGDMTMEPRRSP
jgi:type IV pilus assembly protein PilQ